MALLLAVLAAAACARPPCPPAPVQSPAPARAPSADSPAALGAAPASAPAPAAREQSAAPDPDLVGFSRATCFAYYLQEKGWDAQSARNIAGGYVELGTASAEAYEALARFIADFEPPLGSKHPIDAHLSRCFQIEDDATWQRLVRAS